MNNRTKAALIGGVLAGVLSGLPLISGCCFLWAIGGGFLAVFMYLKDAPPGPLEMGDAAKLGALAGAIGAVISLVLGLPFMLLGIGASAVQNSGDLERAGISSGIMAVGGIVGLILRAALVVGFAVLGGVIGAAVLGKNRPGGVGTPPPPPPADFGGSGGGYGGTTPPAGGGYGGTVPPAGGSGGSFGAGS